jgi:AbiV family abortive infection protein
MDYKKGANICNVNAQRLRTTAKIIIGDENGTNSYALYLYGVANEELAKSIWCLFVHKDWVDESFIQQIFSWHHTKLFLLEEMLESVSVVDGKGLLGGQELGIIPLKEFVDKHEDLIEESRKQARVSLC